MTPQMTTIVHRRSPNAQRDQLATDRLMLRPFQADDLVALSAIFSDPIVMQYTATGQPKSPKLTAYYLENQQGHHAHHGFSLWAVIRRSDDRLIGQCGLAYLEDTGEIGLGYTLAPDCWGRGYGTEASRAWLEYGFNGLEFNRIVAVVKPENRSSIRVLDKLGLRYEKEGYFYSCACAYYAISRDQWNGGNSASTL